MAVTKFYPNVTGTVDGMAKRTGSYELFSSIRNALGNGSSTTELHSIISTDSSAFYSSLSRGLVSFDTSSLDDVNITAVKLSVYVKGKYNNGTNNYPSLDIAEGDLATAGSIANGDFEDVSRTSFGNTAYASLSGRTDITLNSSGRANVNQSGKSTYSLQVDWDLDNSFGGNLNDSSSYGFQFYDSSEGTTTSPYLEVTYDDKKTLTETISITDNVQKGIKRTILEQINLTDVFKKSKYFLNEIISIVSNATVAKKFTQLILETIQITSQVIIRKNGLNILWNTINRTLKGGWNKITRK